jgi:hypothetical protein
LHAEIGEEQMVIKNDPRSKLPLSTGELAPVPRELEIASRRHNTLTRLQGLVTDARKKSKSLLQIRWERRWTAAAGAWFAVLSALLLGGIDWRAALMVAATAFMLARSGDMLDDYDE